MDQLIKNKMYESVIIDFTKPEIDRFTRAKIIREYLSSNNISGREFGKRFNLPKSTVEDWLLWEKVDEKQFKELEQLGFGKSEVYKFLRNNKKSTKVNLEEIKKSMSNFSLERESELDRELFRINNLLKRFLDYHKKTKKTALLVADLKKTLDILVYRFS